MIKDLLKEELSLSSESKALSFYGGLFLVCIGLFSIIWLFILTRGMVGGNYFYVLAGIILFSLLSIIGFVPLIGYFLVKRRLSIKLTAIALSLLLLFVVNVWVGFNGTSFSYSYKTSNFVTFDSKVKSTSSGDYSVKLVSGSREVTVQNVKNFFSVDVKDKVKGYKIQDMTVVSEDIFGNSEKKVVEVTEIILQKSKGE